MNLTFKFSLALACILMTSSAFAQHIAWRPVNSNATKGSRDCAIVRLGKPIIDGASPTCRPPFSRGSIIRAQDLADLPPAPPPPLPGLGGDAEAYNCAVPTELASPEARPGLFDTGTSNRFLFQSDHGFDDFISPVTNPFFFEDPRSLTEVKALYMYQKTPGGQPFYAGGDIHVASLQARVALTERLSVVMNRVGWIWLNPKAPATPHVKADGLSELYIGPKFTFIRNDCTRTLLAGGLTFQIPIGETAVFQDTGDLGLVPYLSFGQAFLESYYGRFHFLNTTGYSFSVDSVRTEFFFSSFHLDYDILKWGRVYPFAELNWFYYAKNGGNPVVAGQTFEGRDLINFGATAVSGSHDLSLAGGIRFKPSEILQFGIAAEFPLLSKRDLMQYRLTVDVILRY